MGFMFFSKKRRDSVKDDSKQAATFVNDDGYTVAWTLHSPAVLEYGDWALVDIQYRGEGKSPLVTFMRQLTTDEINSIRRRFMVWSNKLPGVPWAEVRGRQDSFGASGVYDITATATTKRSVGV